MVSDTDRLLTSLARLPHATRFRVGFSGGADSTALLTMLCELGGRCPAPIAALHFNHGLHPLADEWQVHCEQFCSNREIPFHAVRLEVPFDSGGSPELAARRARYTALGALLGAGEIYLTAHHANDRAETLFLNLMRGSGIDGLASIPALRRCGAGWVARPLLEFARQDLERILSERNISWLEDPANRDPASDRNYLRHDLFPELERRWPGLAGRLARTADQARRTMDAIAADLDARHGHLILDSGTLAAGALLRLPADLQALLIRHWVRGSGLAPPPYARLTEFLRQLCAPAAAARAVELRWDGWQIKRHRDFLWMHPCPFPSPCPEQRWTRGEKIDLGGGFGSLYLGAARAQLGPLEVGPRRRGARMRLHANGPRRPVKDLLRECGVPPWLRDSIPVLYREGEPLAVGDWALAADFRDWLDGHDAEYHWHPEDELLRRVRERASTPGGLASTGH